MEQRRLAAIMFTDFVGYSALTQRDEAAALRLLEKHNALLRPIIRQFQGTEIKTIGDAFLLEFQSALDAVRCAVEIQRAIHERNSAVSPDDRFLVRIGLHVGDIVAQDGDVFGDGVNITARIEPLAAPGGICISEDVARQVQNKIERPIVKLGRGELKNITTPVQIYRVVLPWESRSMALTSRLRFLFARKAPVTIGTTLIVSAIAYALFSTSGGPPADTKHRIAVLPLSNISPEADEDYFSDGMTEEFISSLSKIRGLSVIARSSVLKYRGAQFDIMAVGRDLDVRAILGGSIRKAGDRVRISVQLIDVATQGVLWSNEYERELQDVFAIQSDVAMRVASELKIQLVPSDHQRLEKKGTEDPKAHRAYLLGRFYLNKRTNEDNVRAIGYFDEALGHDPSYALAYVGLAECYTLIGGAGYQGVTRDEAVRRATAASMRAIELDEHLSEAHTVLGYVKFRLEWNWLEAEREFQTALELQPGYAKVYEWYALYLALLGRGKEAIPMMKRALDLDPLSASVNTGLARFYSFNGEHAEAIKQFQKTLEIDPNYGEAYFGLGLTYSYLDRFDEGIAAVNKAIELSGRRHIMLSNLAYLHARAGDKKAAVRILEEFDRLSKTSRVSPYNYAIIYVGLGDLDKAFQEFEKAYEEREGLLVYMKSDELLGAHARDPRYQELLRKIGFP